MYIMIPPKVKNNSSNLKFSVDCSDGFVSTVSNGSSIDALTSSLFFHKPSEYHKKFPFETDPEGIASAFVNRPG